ncbi:hypothetical protein NO2_1252 [Candidatus Termititenax persephonae]|uniref:Uncharacterized protein n=1 Tax=Candidatus Termititenax persephonae TaxID=2218525 RepID=A0A388TIU9_9BACT|nr:hypothetical protein NO2_1252 [Candidatus Termititenax persephonae]
MKKIIILLCVMSLGFSMIKIQAQTASIGEGFGLGLGLNVIPLLLEAGIEGSTHVRNYNSTGTYEYDQPGGTTVKGETKGTFTTNLHRTGGYLKFSIPGLNLIPFVGIFAYPTLHIGAQEGRIQANGDVRFFGQGEPFDGSLSVRGSYALLGFPSYLAWFYFEPSLGVQHIYIPGKVNLDIVDAQLALGLNF